MHARRAIINVAIAALIFVSLYAKVMILSEIPDSSAKSVVPIYIVFAYCVVALLFVGLYENLISFDSLIEHPLLGITFIVPMVVFLHEITRSRDYMDEATRKDRYSVYRVSVLVTIAVAATSTLDQKARIKVACIALGAATTLFPLSSALPWTPAGASYDTVQRAGLVSATWLIVGIVSHEIAKRPKMGYLFR